MESVVLFPSSPSCPVLDDMHSRYNANIHVPTLHRNIIKLCIIFVWHYTRLHATNGKSTTESSKCNFFFVYLDRRLLHVVPVCLVVAHNSTMQCMPCSGPQQYLYALSEALISHPVPQHSYYTPTLSREGN